MPENKAVSFVFEGSKLIVSVDPNKDGEVVLRVEIDMAEIPDEVLSVLNSKKAV